MRDDEVSGGGKFISVDQAESLSIEEVWSLYSRYVSTSQVDLLSSFGAGRDLAQSAEGCYITTKSGKKILDLTGGIGVLNHGHNNPTVLAARRRFAMQRRMEVHKNFFSPYTAALSANVAQMLPADLSISFFPNSGSEAVEGALKMAYKFHDGRRNTALHADISFHGKLLGAASLTGSRELHFKFPQIQRTDAFTYGELDSVRSAVKRHRKPNGTSDIYALIVEPLSASSMRQLDARFLKAIREICSEEGIVLIFDEVYTGWGKTGRLFNFMRVPDLVPDILTYAKSFGGGKASLAGYTAREEIARRAYDNLRDATLHSTTYYGFGEESATAITALEVLNRDQLVERAAALGELVGPRLNDLAVASSFAAEVRGDGALWGIVLKKTWIESAVRQVARLRKGVGNDDPQLGRKVVTGALVNHLYNEYNILTYFGSNEDLPLILSFPLVATEIEVDLMEQALRETLTGNLTKLVVDFARYRAAKL